METKAFFATSHIILLLLGIGLVQETFHLSGYALLTQLIYVIMFIIASIIASLLITSKNHRGTFLYLTIVGMSLFEILLLHTTTGSPLTRTFLFVMVGIIGFFSGIFHLSPKKTREKREENVMDLSEEPPSSEVKEGEPLEVLTYGNTETTFSPAKFIASRDGVKYHSPKCIWAKKINKRRRIWIDSHEKAFELGYKKCNCLQD